MPDPRQKAHQIMVGVRLRRARKGTGMRQSEVAAELGISQPIVSNIERGERKLDPYELRRLAELYDVPFEELAGPPSPEEQAELDHAEWRRRHVENM